MDLHDGCCGTSSNPSGEIFAHLSISTRPGGSHLIVGSLVSVGKRLGVLLLFQASRSWWVESHFSSCASTTWSSSPLWDSCLQLNADDQEAPWGRWHQAAAFPGCGDGDGNFAASQVSVSIPELIQEGAQKWPSSAVFHLGTWSSGVGSMYRCWHCWALCAYEGGADVWGMQCKLGTASAALAVEDPLLWAGNGHETSFWHPPGLAGMEDALGFDYFGFVDYTQHGWESSEIPGEPFFVMIKANK